jgi:hypothetical protein
MNGNDFLALRNLQKDSNRHDFPEQPQTEDQQY